MVKEKSPGICQCIFFPKWWGGRGGGQGGEVGWGNNFKIISPWDETKFCFEPERFGSDADCYTLRNLILKFYISDFDPNPQLRSDSLEEHIIPDQLASESGPESDGGSLGCSFGIDEAEGFDINFSDSEEEREPEPLPILEILNRFCLKVKEEAMISDKAVERIRTVTISLLKTVSQQSKAQVTKIPQDNGIDTTNMSVL